MLSSMPKPSPKPIPTPIPLPDGIGSPPPLNRIDQRPVPLVEVNKIDRSEFFGLARDVSSKLNTVVDPKTASEAESDVDSLANTGVATSAKGDLNPDSLKMLQLLPRIRVLSSIIACPAITTTTDQDARSEL
ncbi:uncharacterized protein PGTG_06218 [Puccinia graminis f. sp. tritici CRL 75-36-700-3]|uniref:Uncharacterized protein n=1 Tax=Puccinia graminis f. sp. tritici (strain CRL 75-36-700-3 / race SCCL) TaxID=418459 RepID=E3K7C6_PUCGT|nr:uncharacterized protein PGTG_06218 [Puccinia graminis f. sp. tritici CRL 75-36-700-3]EFP80262.1 hypothetical protein PGTG_06218 [Puccinia graminis f. sp. tritici CRL 75-36-700-3]